MPAVPSQMKLVATSPALQLPLQARLFGSDHSTTDVNWPVSLTFPLMFSPHVLDIDMSSEMRPPLISYGTAWKKDRTTALVYEALKVGFRGIDTACQPKHYR